VNGPATLRRLFGYARPYRGRIAWAVVGMVVYAAGSAGLAWLVQPIFDNVLLNQSRLAFTAYAIVFVYFLKGLGSYISSYLMVGVGQRVVMDLRNALYRHVLGQSAAFFSQRTTGQLMSRIGNDVTQVQQTVSETAVDLARESLALIGLAALLFYYDAWLAVFCIVSAPLVVYPLVRLGQRVRRTSRRSQEAIEQLSHISAEAFTGHRIVKAFGTESTEAERFRRAGYHLFRTNMKVTAALSSLPPLIEIIGGLGLSGALWYGSREIAAGELTPGEFTSFIAALFLMYGPAKKLSRVNANLQQSISAAERIFEMLDVHTEAAEKPEAPPLAPFTRSIEFREVGFEYDGGHHILRDVSFSVDAGRTIAIVGRSGAGKTTLVNLLPRFYDVTSGAILIDGVDVRDVTLPSLRAQIGIVTQDTILFDDTIAGNIAYGSAGASAQEIEAAARAAHAHEFIEPLPDGYATMIGERGQRLSGGQRQRLAIARAILRDAPVLILDEATAALDTESERLVQDALTRLMPDRTTLVIAHRLSTIEHADQVLVLDHGRLVEQGTHAELLRQGGLYAHLHGMQFREQAG
jgi:ATP-binding cassette, subfamily B, bacterial MsbA